MKKLKIFLATLLIRTIGRLSTGIDLSFKYGFISGRMLDYIYENKPQGKFIIGKMIDRVFLNNVGWQAIRQRKENLKKFIKEEIVKNQKQGRKTVILDIASGPAKYLLEVLADYQETEVYAICQDIDQRWLDFGKAQAERAGIGNIRFEKGDAFNREMLLKVLPRPNLVVSSGFYDWITDDALIKKSFIYCAQILEKGGMMIFTNQAGHRDLELVSAAFVDFNQAPLRMKTRPAQTINEWAKEAGFQNLETAIDKWGLYSVTKGERR